MLMSTRLFLAWSCLALLLTMASWLATLSSSYQECTADPSYSQAQDESNNPQGGPVREFAAHIKTFLRCEGVFVDKHNGSLALIATFAIAAFTLTRWLATSRNARLTRESIELARDEFIADKRPRLRVRNVVVRPASVTGYYPTLFHPKQFVGGQCYIANHGGTDAIIVEAHCEVFWTNIPLPMQRPYEGKNAAIRSTIPPGGSLPFPFQSDRPLGERESDDIKSGGNCQIYVLGWVEYDDLRGVRRRTAFCRMYDPVRLRFFAVDDLDYEHEE